MKRLLHIALPLLFALCSCVPDFDPRTDSDVCSLVLDVDVMPMLGPVRDWRTGECLFKDGKIDDEYRDSVALLLSAYCYKADNDTLAGRTSVLVRDFSEPVRMEIRHLSKSEEYKYIVVAEFKYINGYASLVDVWYHPEARRYSQFYVSCYKSLKGYVYDVVGGCTGIAKPEESPAGLSLSGFGKFMIIEFLNVKFAERVHFQYNEMLTFYPFSEGNCLRGNRYRDFYPQAVSKDLIFCEYCVPSHDEDFEISCELYSGASGGPQICNASVDFSGAEGGRLAVNCANGHIEEIERW